MSKINEKLDKVYEFIFRYVKDNGFPPSVREIGAAIPVKSTATVFYYLKKLEERGLIEQTGNKKRAIRLKNDETRNSISVPLLGVIAAGTPIFAEENLEGYYPISAEFDSGEDMFMLSVRGTSMIEAGILDGDKVICVKSRTAENGEIVAALTDGENATVKRFYKRGGKVVLHPENSALTDIILDDVEILGIVKGLLRKY